VRLFEHPDFRSGEPSAGALARPSLYLYGFHLHSPLGLIEITTRLKLFRAQNLGALNPKTPGEQQ
jgi:hypothetical protein